MQTPSPSPVHFAPRCVLIGARAHAEIGAVLRAQRPDLELRGAQHTDITAADLDWADAYIGFKRPPAAATMGNVRWVHCTGAGVDSWLSPVELDRGILLTRTSESFGPMIAEWAVARVLAFQQQIVDLAVAQRERRWAPRDLARVAGTRALVVGTGDVGTAVATALAGLGCEVTGVSRTGVSRTGLAQTDVERSGLARTGTDARRAFVAEHPVSALADLVADAQWIVLTLPDTPATRGLISRDVLSRCRGAVLLNAGRGSVVDEAALPEALERGWLRGAALDVFTTEPLPEHSPLWADSRVMISPHISGITTPEGAAGGFLECLAELERGRLPKWVVDRERGY